LNKKNYTTPKLQEIGPENLTDRKIAEAIQKLQQAATGTQENREAGQSTILPRPVSLLTDQK